MKKGGQKPQGSQARGWGRGEGGDEGATGKLMEPRRINLLVSLESQGRTKLLLEEDQGVAPAQRGKGRMETKPEGPDD